MGEALCGFYRQQHGVDFISLRYSTVYGERQHNRGLNVVPMVQAYDRIQRGLPPVIPGDGTEVHDYIYAGDVARANLLAMTAQVSGEVFIIASGVPTSFNQLVAYILAACGSNLRPEHNIDPNRLRSAGATVERFSYEKAKATLGWEPGVSIEAGVRKYVAWRRNSAEQAAAMSLQG